MIPFLAFTLTLLLSAISSQEVAKQENCTHSELLLDRRGNPVQLNSKATQKRIVQCEKAKSAHEGKGIIQIRILIDPDGRAACATALTGHPILKKVAIDTVQKWRFKPMKKEGKNIAVYGLVSVRVSWDPSIGKDSCPD